MSPAKPALLKLHSQPWHLNGVAMKNILAKFLNFIWYKDHFFGLWLLPFSVIYIESVSIRRFLYRIRLFKTTTVPAPVIIIGNITVGGTGKTPLVIWMAELLKQHGYIPGIISRGYGGKSQQWPQQVTAESDPAIVGDEAVLMASRCACPVIVGPQRVKSATRLIEQFQCNVILSDDGLQHYALARDIEIIAIDAQRRFGNSYFLPAGPLREQLDRLQKVDLVICNGDAYEENEFSMHVQGHQAINLSTGEQRDLSSFADQPCHAVAAIGNPERFFTLLQHYHIAIKKHSFMDHHPYAAEDIMFTDQHPVIMTEKDAVKCKAYATKQHWYVPVSAQPELRFEKQLLDLLKTKAKTF